MTSRTTGSQERIQRLAAARAADSLAKTQRALGAVQRLVDIGQRVTFTSVARHADVSTWFLYNKDEVRRAVGQAIGQQQRIGVTVAARPSTTRVKPAALQAELEMARDEIRTLRQERDRYRRRAQERLGDEVDDMSHGQLGQQLGAYQQRVAELQTELRSALDRAAAAEQRRDELEDQLTAARANLKKMIRSVPARQRGAASSSTRSGPETRTDT